MLSERGRRALLGMLQNATLAQDFVQGLTFEAFAADRRTLYAVTRCLEIISEASRRIDAATVERHRHVPWREMADAGNVYRHRYDNVSARLVWRTVHDRLPELVAVCRAELGSATPMR
jgi:uncharacterized protein with HEPN domain